MTMSQYNDNEEKLRSTRSNTISEQLFNDLQEDYGFPPAVCRYLAKDFLDMMDFYYGDEAPHSRVVGYLMFQATEVALTIACPNHSRAAEYND
ncbi:MAG: hypothetical protein HF974_12750 [ANME-2 cluster archaeon]|nr:hypothetical protein [ANME-2 cluster archaeon]